MRLRHFRLRRKDLGRSRDRRTPRRVTAGDRTPRILTPRYWAAPGGSAFSAWATNRQLADKVAWKCCALRRIWSEGVHSDFSKYMSTFGVRGLERRGMKFRRFREPRWRRCRSRSVPCVDSVAWGRYRTGPRDKRFHLHVVWHALRSAFGRPQPATRSHSSPEGTVVTAGPKDAIADWRADPRIVLLDDHPVMKRRCNPRALQIRVC